MDIRRLIIICCAWVGGCVTACTGRAERDGVAVDSLRYLPAARVPSGFLAPTRAGADSFLVHWYSGTLVAFNEPSLPSLQPPPDEAYRFLWLRSFHRPVVVRVERTSRSAFVVVKEGDDVPDAQARVTRADSTALTTRGWDSVVALINLEHLWQRPSADTSRLGLDGAQWIFEGLRSRRYAIVDRWSPTDTGSSAFARRLGVAFLRLGKIVIPPDRLY